MKTAAPPKDRTGLIPRARPVRRRTGIHTQRYWIRPEELARTLRGRPSTNPPAIQPSLLDVVPFVPPAPLQPTPGEVYRLLGTQAPAFKAWFGDYDADPAEASKVVRNGAPEEQEPAASCVQGADGTPLVLFHGSPAVFREFKPSTVDEGCELGPGFYFTQTEALAGDGTNDDPGYRLRRLMFDGPDQAALCDALSELVSTKTGLSEALKARALGQLAIWRQMPVVSLGDAMDAFAGEPYSLPVMALAGMMGLTSRGKTYAVYLNIRRPVDLTDPNAVKTFAGHVGAGQASKTGDLGELLLELGGGQQLNAVAREFGYDGIRFAMSDDAGALHVVWVAFESNQIKAKDNAGTFRGDTADIYKALWRPEQHPRGHHGRFARKWASVMQDHARPLSRDDVPDHPDKRFNGREFDKIKKRNYQIEPLGEEVHIPDGLFRHLFLSGGSERQRLNSQFVRTIVPTITHPIEIWEVADSHDGKPSLLCLSAYRVEGGDPQGVYVAASFRRIDGHLKMLSLVVAAEEYVERNIRAKGRLRWAEWAANIVKSGSSVVAPCGDEAGTVELETPMPNVGVADPSHSIAVMGHVGANNPVPGVQPPAQIIAKSASEFKYNYCSTQVDIHGAIVHDLLAWCHGNLDSSWITEPGLKDPHITVKYGLICPTLDDAAALRSALHDLVSHFDAPVAQLGTVGLFRSNPDFDVVYVGVESAALAELNAAIGTFFPCVTTHPTYIPHLTLAYVTKGVADGLLGDDGFGGTLLQFDTLTLSERDGTRSVLRFGIA